MNMLVYGHKGSVVKNGLQPLVNRLIEYKGVMKNLTCRYGIRFT